MRAWLGGFRPKKCQRIIIIRARTRHQLSTGSRYCRVYIRLGHSYLVDRQCNAHLHIHVVLTRYNDKLDSSMVNRVIAATASGPMVTSSVPWAARSKLLEAPFAHGNKPIPSRSAYAPACTKWYRERCRTHRESDGTKWCQTGWVDHAHMSVSCSAVGLNSVRR